MKIRPLVALLGSITLGVRKCLDLKVRMAKVEVGLHRSNKTIRGCFHDYGERHHPFKLLKRR